MNEQNLRPKHFTTETARAAQKKGVETKRRRKSIAEALRIALEQPSTEHPGLTQLEEIALGAVKKMKETQSISDVRIAADILGELEQKVQVDGEVDWHFKFGRDK